MLTSLSFAPPMSYGALTVIPLVDGALGEPGWITLGEAGAVPYLTVTNAADQPLLLIDGEELIGAKQNRILNTTVLVAARATVTIPVSRVEQGRWANGRRRAAPPPPSGRPSAPAPE